MVSNAQEKLEALMEGLGIQNIGQFLEAGKIGDYRRLGERYRELAAKNVNERTLSHEVRDFNDRLQSIARKIGA
jgi:hypothetical protein